MAEQLTDPAKLLLLSSLLEKERIITRNGKGFLKELILDRDERLNELLSSLDSSEGQDGSFLDTINQLIEQEAHDLFDRLFSQCPLDHGKTVSKAEREEKELTDQKSLIYGEVEFFSFAKVLRKIQPAPGGKFYDLGSGTGKALFVARFLHDFDQCVGIEILEGLHQCGLAVVDLYEREFRQFMAVSQPGDVSLVHGSLLDGDWSDGDVVFANSTCFDDELMEAISKKAEDLKPGAFIVTFTKGLSSTAFEVMERKRYKMSWGPATVWIHRRRHDDGTPFSTEQLNNIEDDDSYNEDDQDDEEDEDEEDEEEAEEGGGEQGTEDLGSGEDAVHVGNGGLHGSEDESDDEEALEDLD